MTTHVLTLNAGSSSLKVGLYPADSGTAILKGQVEGIGTAPKLRLDKLPERDLELGGGHRAALHAILEGISEAVPNADIRGVAHRIVHGGPDRGGSRLIDDAEIEALERLAPFAPLHQPHNLAGARAAIEAFPDALQVACFDTAFHRAQPWVNDTFALPREYYDKGVRRYGFHGLSYDYINAHLAQEYPDLHAGRVVVAHLGNGASMCGIKAGQPIASTMGFSPADGLAMGTRTGQIDPGVLLYMMTEEGLDAEAINDVIYRRSGLLGLSGISNDMRSLESSDDPKAAQAIEYFCARIRREAGSLAAAMEGIDALVFTAGIGENSPTVRAEVTKGMGWLGIEIDAEANTGRKTDITAPGAATRTLVLPTDEESVLARGAQEALSAS